MRVARAARSAAGRTPDVVVDAAGVDDAQGADLDAKARDFPIAVPFRRDDGSRWALALTDLAAAALAMGGVALVEHKTAVLLAAAFLIVVLYKIGGLYERDELVLNKTTLEELPSVVQMSGLFTLLVWLSHDGYAGDNFEPPDMLGLWAAVIILPLAGRVLARRLLRAHTEPERCLLIGAPDSLGMLKAKLKSAKVGVDVVKSITLEPGTGMAEFAAHPWYLRTIAHQHDIHRVVIAPAATDGYDTLDLIRLAKSAGVRVSVLPRLLGVVGTSVEFDEIEGLTLLGLRSFGLSRSSFLLKRCFDVTLAVLALIAVAPLMIALALAIVLDSRGPIFFRQTRVGRNGEPFQIIKFRSMVVGAEARRGEVDALNETHGLFKSSADPRRTRVGRVIRETCLDELPQLFNVLRGEMSLVGPRPLVVDEDAKVAGLDRARLHLTPGMTGHWQILGSTRLPLDEMVGIDYLYVANWTLWTDCKILLRTIVYVLSRRGM